MNENEEITTPTTEEVATPETVVEETAEVKVEEVDNNAPNAEVIAEEEAKIATGEDFSQPHNAPGVEDHVPTEEVAPVSDEASA